MSPAASTGDALLSKLRGHSATFVVDGRETNLAFARAMVARCSSGGGIFVLDIDALYSSNADFVFSGLSHREAQSVEILVPDPLSSIESSFVATVGSAADKTVIIDSLNSLYHLLSSGARGLKGRKLSFAAACVSHIARTDGRTVLLTMYQRDRATRFGIGKGISRLSDLTFTVTLAEGTLSLKCVSGYLGAGTQFLVPVTSR